MSNARRLHGFLAEIDGLTPQHWDPRVDAHAHHLFLMRYDAERFGGLPRQNFIAALRAENVPTATLYAYPLYRQPPLVEPLSRVTPCPNSELLCEQTISLSQNLLLAEPDEMLKMGFIEDVDFIMACIMQEYQTLLFSATMPSEIERLTNNTSNRPSASISTATSGHPNRSPITSSTSPAAAVTRSSITSRTTRSNRASYSATRVTKHPICSATYKGASARLTSSTAG